MLFMECSRDNHPERVDKKLMEKENTLNMEGIEYPVSLKDINKFEKQSPAISTTVLGMKEKAFILLETVIIRIGIIK